MTRIRIKSGKREKEREREKRREWDERDRRDRVSDERRDRGVDERKDRVVDERLPPAAAAYASTQEPDRQARDRRYEDDDRDRKTKDRRRDEEDRERKPRRVQSSDDGSSDERPRHYVERDAARDNERRLEPAPVEPALDPDEEYRRRIQQEVERAGRAGRDRDTDPDKERERRKRKEERDRSRDRSLNARSRGSPPNVTEPTHSRYDERSGSIIDNNNKFFQEPDSIEGPTGEREQPNRSVTIVEPPKESVPAPRGILRKPTEKFPEDPDPIREGVAPHKSALKGKDIPVGARWTKIDRRLVNPQALDEAKERFEERMDCVIVLRVLTKEEIQKLADRTKVIREKRGMCQ